MNPKLLVEAADGDGVATITLNRPEKRNAIDFETWGLLRDAATRLGADPAVRVVVLTGAGGLAFSAGADIADFPAHRSDAALAREYAEAFEGALDAVERMPKPVICKIRGICVGGGCELATAADLRVASEDSYFAIPVAKIGVLLGYNEMRRLLRLVGPGHASALLLGARRVDAQEALRIGLVTEAVPPERLDERVASLAREMAAYAPLTQAGHKRIIQTTLRDPALAGLTDEERGLPLAVFDTEDAREGYRAFLEKRPPRFQGR